MFLIPSLISLAAFAAVFAIGGVHALLLVIILSILETTLSFDNAVVNARVLERMSPVWQRRFLTWGILVAVFGTRFILPILIVAAAAGLSPILVTQLALFNPTEYGERLHDVHVSIAAFGSAFLFLVALKYFFNESKKVHWIELIERRLSRLGRIEAIEIALVLSALVVCAALVPAHAVEVLAAGIIGVVLFVAIEGIAHSFDVEDEKTLAASSGLMLFIYLNILDSAFSLDGVIGAFAITTQLSVIIAGLGIGALFVRTFTVYLVQKKTLDLLPYLEHGAHWAIFGLAFAMLIGIFMPVPEVFTGLVGLVFIALSYWSSRREIARMR